MEILHSDLLRTALASETAVKLLKKTVPPLDKRLLRLSRGWVNVGLQPVALVQTLGAKTGATRTIATLCMPVGSDLVLIGSNWGNDKDPAWMHNLRANPQCTVTFRGYSGAMDARELKGRERATMWEHVVRYNPQYQRYQDGTLRQLPVMLLQRI